MMRSLVVLSLFVASTYALSLGKTIIDPNLNWKINGGAIAPDGEYPHQISLKRDNVHRCGGAIIDEEWVITAAHCTYGISIEEFQIFAGSNKLDTGGYLYQVLEVHEHEFYNVSTSINDIAILKVEKMTFNDKVNKIALQKDDVPGGVSVTLSGWGTIGSGQRQRTNELKHIHLKSISVQQCKDELPGGNFPVLESNICTSTTVGQGMCFGDSGSPLIVDDNGNRKVVGLASWIRACAYGFPDVHARVSSFAEWFNEKCKCL